MYRKEIETFLKRVSVWTERYAPDTYRISLEDGSAKGLGKAEREYLSEFASKLRTKEDVKDICKGLMESYEVPAQEFFANVYRVLFGKDHGPRLAEFMEVYGRAKVAEAMERVLE